MFTGNQPIDTNKYERMTPDEQLQAVKEMGEKSATRGMRAPPGAPQFPTPIAADRTFSTGMVFNYLNEESVWEAFCETYEAIYYLMGSFDNHHHHSGTAGVPQLKKEWKEYIEVVLRSLVRRSLATFDKLRAIAMARYGKELQQATSTSDLSLQHILSRAV